MRRSRIIALAACRSRRGRPPRRWRPSASVRAFRRSSRHRRGLDQVKSLLDHAEPPPSQPPRSRADRMPAIAAPDDPVEPLTNELFADPPARYRPWTRWWWLGNRVDEAELRRQVAMFVEKGFGGVEIQAFSLGDRVDRRPGHARSRSPVRHRRVLGQRARDARRGARRRARRRSQSRQRMAGRRARGWGSATPTRR